MESDGSDRARRFAIYAIEQHERDANSYRQRRYTSGLTWFSQSTYGIASMRQINFPHWITSFERQRSESPVEVSIESDFRNSPMVVGLEPSSRK